MEYRRLGSTGLKVSVLGLGSWVTFGNQLDQGLARACMAAAFEAGVNFFDNAESYASGESERLMGAAFAQLGWVREDYVVSTKFFWGIRDGVNTRNTLNRKYLLAAIDPSLERLGLDFVDIVYCHRPDPETPVEETVWAMHDIVASGRALYWGTSEWPVERIKAALEFAERHHLRAPVVEQPQYNLLARARVEREYAPLYEHPGLGLTVWSPLASGVLTGKYLHGIPAGSRIALPGYEWLRDAADDAASRQKVAALVGLAGELGCTPAQLAIAWCARHPHVSSVITGASSVEQVRENLGALDVLARLDDGVASRIDAITA
jgi:voltage-dependent potassium channel beta subunit